MSWSLRFPCLSPRTDRPETRLPCHGGALTDSLRTTGHRRTDPRWPLVCAHACRSVRVSNSDVDAQTLTKGVLNKGQTDSCAQYRRRCCCCPELRERWMWGAARRTFRVCDSRSRAALTGRIAPPSLVAAVLGTWLCGYCLSARLKGLGGYAKPLKVLDE